TKNSVNITLTSLTRQSHVVVVSAPISVRSLHTDDFVIPIARDSGSQNTLKPYAMPMHRWIASAAGGTTQRLKPGRAMMRSRSRMLGAGSKASMLDLASWAQCSGARDGALGANLVVVDRYLELAFAS